MSSYLMKPKPVSEIADFIACVLNNGFNYFGFEGNNHLVCALSQCRTSMFYSENIIYKLLSELNVKAVCANDEKVNVVWEEYKKYPPVYHPHHYDVKEEHFCIEHWHYELLKKLDCFLYQCDENSVINTELFIGVSKLRDTLSNFIVTNNPTYASIKWGE